LNEPVVLKKHPLRWRKLPLGIKTALVKEVQRVTRIRDDIARCAQVSVMPWIDIVDVCWATRFLDGVPEGCVHGRTTLLRRGESQSFGVELTAPTVLYTDDQGLRGVLLHEFSHVFYFTRQLLREQAAGKTFVSWEPAGDVADDEEWDRATLERPEDWFGHADVTIFPYWHSKLLDKFMERIAEDWINKGLPVELGTGEFHARHVGLFEEIVAHAQRLEARG
jgi:hypothetical protein